MTSTHRKNRRFNRIPFSAVAHITKHQSDVYQNIPVHDISLHGVLMARPENWSGEQSEEYQLELELENGQLVITMTASVAHIEDQVIGFECTHIDLNAITHLKRLVELNLGDPVLLNRELDALLHQ